jgi:hypothetical protein
MAREELLCDHAAAPTQQRIADADANERLLNCDGHGPIWG